MNEKYKGESVLVVPAKILVEMGIGEGLSGSLYVEKKLKSMFDPGWVKFWDRALAEKDETLKQIIPYVIFKCGSKVFSYVRGKGTGEKRLKGNRSVGIGGHINPVDSVAVRPDYDVFKIAMLREIAEEVRPVKKASLFMEPIAFINDNSNPVGRVHLGVVHVCEVGHESWISRREKQISQSGFLLLSKLGGQGLSMAAAREKRAELENWSLLCVDYLMS